MDAHQAEYDAAVEGMNETYGITPTPPICVTVGTKRIPTWNVGATVCWTDEQGRHRHGTVVNVVYATECRDADLRIYVVKTRDLLSLRERHLELTHTSLLEW